MSEAPRTTPPMALVKHIAPWAILALLAFVCANLWWRLAHVQQQLGEQATHANLVSAEAKTHAKQAHDISRELQGRQSLAEAKLNELAGQRAQLEELVQGLSRSRDENLLEDVDASLRVAQQQADLLGSVQPLVAALKAAEMRVNRAAQPRLAPLARALGKDLARLQAAAATDVPALLRRLDEAVRTVDELPMAASVLPQPTATPTSQAGEATSGNIPQRVERLWRSAFTQAGSLVRLSRIDTPEAALLAPEQAYMLRENLKLRLLNARLALLARQTDSARLDVAAAGASIDKYFLTSARKTQAWSAQLQQIKDAIGQAELPRPDDTLAALRQSVGPR